MSWTVKIEVQNNASTNVALFVYSFNCLDESAASATAMGKLVAEAGKVLAAKFVALCGVAGICEKALTCHNCKELKDLVSSLPCLEAADAEAVMSAVARREEWLTYGSNGT